MEDDIVVRNLVEILFEGRSVEGVLIRPMSDEFLVNIEEVFKTKQIFTHQRWERFFKVFPDKMLSSPEMYLTHTIYACKQEASMNLKIFERILSVLSLLLYITGQTLQRTEVNFCNMMLEVFMLIYYKEIKESFLKCGGFHRFSEYINNPKYLEMNRRYQIYHEDPNAGLSESSRNHFEKILRKEKELPTSFRLEHAARDPVSRFWAKKIVLSKRAKLSSLPNDAGMKEKLSEQKMAQLEEEKKTVEGEVEVLEESLAQSLKLNFDFEITDVVTQNSDTKQHDKIIEAVIKYNHSKSSDHTKKKNEILKEVEKTLEHLKETIKSLIEVITDEYERDCML